MLKIISVCVVSLVLTACGRARDAKVHPLMTEHYDAFMADCAKYNADCKTDNLTIDVVDVLPAGAPHKGVGYCYLEPSLRGLKRHIWILTSTANEESMTPARAVFYHEAGHCMVGLLGLEHVNSKPDVMNSNPAHMKAVMATWEEQVKAMFSRIPKKP